MKSPSNFGRLVRGCMDSYDSNQIVIFAGFFEIYKIFILLHRSDLNISVKKTHARTHAQDSRTGQPKKRAAFSPCVRGSWKLSPNPKLDVFDNTLGLCLTFKNSERFGPPRFSQTYPFSSSLMTTGCIFSIFANFIALAFTSDRRFEKNFARDFIALAPSPVTYLLPAFRKNTSVKHIHALAFTSDLSFARFSKKHMNYSIVVDSSSFTHLAHLSEYFFTVLNRKNLT